MKLSKHLLGGLSFIALAMAGGSVAAQSLEARVAELEQEIAGRDGRLGNALPFGGVLRRTSR
mgnify:CR=1 FL=1